MNLNHTASDRTPFTYLLGWSNINRFYYGVRFAKGCHPSDIGLKYMSSSKHVKSLINGHGLPDIIQIRKIFDSSESARNWETRVLTKLNIFNDEKWLNKTTNIAISPKAAGHSKGRTYEEIYGAEKAAELRKSRSITSRKRKMSEMTKAKISKSRSGKQSSDETKIAIKNAMSSMEVKIRALQGKNKHFCAVTEEVCTICSSKFLYNKRHMGNIVCCKECRPKWKPTPPKNELKIKKVLTVDGNTIYLTIDELCDKFSITKYVMHYIERNPDSTLHSKKYKILSIMNA